MTIKNSDKASESYELSKFQESVKSLFESKIGTEDKKYKLTLEIVKGKPVLDFEYLPEDRGFDVYFGVEEDEYHFSADQWHEHSEYLLPDNLSDKEKARSAIDQLQSLLNGQASIDVHKAGKFAYKWTLCYGQTKNTTGLLFYPFWAKKSIQKLQNKGLSTKLNYNPWE